MLACGVLIGLLFLGVSVGMKYRAPSSSALQEQLAQALELQNGSIVIVPAFGNQCRRLQIDNANWRIQDNGFMDCDELISSKTSAERQKWSAERLEAIRSGLSKR